MTSTNLQSRFTSLVLDRVLGPPCQCDTPDGVLVSLEGELRALEGHCVSSKSPSSQGSETETKGLVGGTEEKCISLTRGN